MSIKKNKINGLKTSWTVSALVLLMAMINCRTYDVTKYYTPLKFNEGVPKMKVILANYMDKGGKVLLNKFTTTHFEIYTDLNLIIENSFHEKHKKNYKGLLVIKPVSVSMQENASTMLLFLSGGFLLGIPFGWSTCEINFDVDVLKTDNLDVVRSYSIHSKAKAAVALYYGYNGFKPIEPYQAACSGAMHSVIKSTIEKINEDQKALNKGL